MNIEYTGRQTAVTKKLKVQAESGLERVAKLVGRGVSAHVVLTEDKHRKIAEVTVNGRSKVLVANCESVEMHGALHAALEKLEQQAVRRRQKFTTTMRHPRMMGRGLEVAEGYSAAG